MCGRFVQYSHPEVYASHFDTELACEEPGPRYNLAPTQPVLAVLETREGRRELSPLRWGLVSSWSKGPDNRYSMINARAETVDTRQGCATRVRSVLSPRVLAVQPRDLSHQWLHLNVADPESFSS